MIDVDKYVGLKIIHVNASDSGVRLSFEDGRSIVLSDDARQCCEKRWMSTSDDVQDLVGKKLSHAVLKCGGHSGSQDECDVHEILFLEILAEDSYVTFANHNEHNGYYSGFDIIVQSSEEENEDGSTDC